MQESLAARYEGSSQTSPPISGVDSGWLSDGALLKTFSTPAEGAKRSTLLGKGRGRQKRAAH